MAYKKQDFRNGDVLTAEQLNHIEDGVVENERNLGLLFTNQPDWMAKKTVIGTEGTVLPETALEFKSTTNFVMLSGYTIVEGETYFVNWNGEAHKVTAGNNDGEIYLGDYDLVLTPDTANKYPFCIAYFGGDGGMVYKKEAKAETITLSIENYYEEKCEPLPNDFLPDGYGYFGESRVERNYLVDNVTVEIPAGNVAQSFKEGENGYCKLVAGEKYNVLYNGIVYKDLVATEESDGTTTMIYIGDMSIVEGNATSDIPFLYSSVKNTAMDACSIYFNKSETVETLSFSIYTETVIDGLVRFNGELMPKGYGYIVKETEATNKIEFDGDYTKYEYIEIPELGVYFVKIHNKPITKEEIIGATAVIWTKNGTQPITITESVIVDQTAQGVPMIAISDAAYVFLDDYEANYLHYTKGIYVMYAPNQMYVQSVTFLTDCIIDYHVIKRFDGKLMPYGYGYLGDYIEAKTIVLNQECVIDDPSDPMYFMIAENLMNEGETYIASINGDEYELRAYSFTYQGTTAVGIGNSGPLGGTDTGEPFLFGTFYNPSTGNINGVYANFTGATSAFITVQSKPKQEVKRFDPRMITASEVVLTSPNGTQFNLTVDDNGNLTATAV